MNDYYEIQSLLVQTTSIDPAMTAVSDEGLVGVMVITADGDASWLVYYGPDYDPNMGEVWVVEDWTIGEEQYEFSSMAAAFAKMDEVFAR